MTAESFTRFGRTKGLIGKFRAATRAPDGTFWFVSDGRANGEGGLFHFDGRSFTRWSDTNSLSESGGFDLYSDDAGMIWAGSLQPGQSV